MDHLNLKRRVFTAVTLGSFFFLKAQSQQEINAQQQVLRMEKAFELSEPEKRELYNLSIDFKKQKESTSKKNLGNRALI